MGKEEAETVSIGPQVGNWTRDATRNANLLGVVSTLTSPAHSSTYIDL